jgi:hypothetical protein
MGGTGASAMKELAELRVDEDFASMVFADSEGKRLGDGVRKIEIRTSDPRFAEIGRLDRELNEKEGKRFFYGWHLRREYTPEELNRAELFLLWAKACFEPEGESCGTRYDEVKACPRCGSGAKQVGPLFLDVRRIPKFNDFARTIADELVASRRVVELFQDNHVSGAEFKPVRHRGSSGVESERWFQFTVRSAEAEIVPPTRVGVDPFDDDPKGEFRCPLGDLIGLNRLTEVWINSSTRGNDDLVWTRQFIGTRRGVLRPRREMLCSRKLCALIDSEKLRGLSYEVAHVV